MLAELSISHGFLIFKKNIYKNNSFSLRPEHAFFNFMEAANTNILLTLFLCSGQMATHRIQEMHRLSSVFRGSFLDMAPTGHLRTHRPHALQSLSVSGTRGMVWYSL
jgi:hypothetical protein